MIKDEAIDSYSENILNITRNMWNGLDKVKSIENPDLCGINALVKDLFTMGWISSASEYPAASATQILSWNQNISKEKTDELLVKIRQSEFILKNNQDLVRRSYKNALSIVIKRYCGIENISPVKFNSEYKNSVRGIPEDIRITNTDDDKFFVDANGILLKSLTPSFVAYNYATKSESPIAQFISAIIEHGKNSRRNNNLIFDIDRDQYND